VFRCTITIDHYITIDHCITIANDLAVGRQVLVQPEVRQRLGLETVLEPLVSSFQLHALSASKK
jgi:hypothetical protein